MKIGEHLRECPKCKCKWLKREEQYAIHKEKGHELAVRYRYVCSECGTQVTAFEERGEI